MNIFQIYIVKQKQAVVLTALRRATLCSTPGQINREWQQQQQPDFCSLPCHDWFCPEWIQGNGGTTFWTFAAGQATWQVRKGAQRIYNVPVCLSEGRPAAVELPVTNQQSDAWTLKDTDTHTHTLSDEYSRVCLSARFAFHRIDSDMQHACVRACVRASVWQANSRGSWAVTADTVKEPGHINQRNRCLHAVLPV